MRTTLHSLQVATPLVRFIEDEVLPGTGISAAAFWSGFEAIVRDLAPRNATLLAERDRLQAEIDAWHRSHPGPINDMPAYRGFLQRIGYLQPVPTLVQTSTANVDAELAQQAGPQLVVPLLNARYALNAANARWGSLYDALYGTDALPETDGAERGSRYNPVRGAQVIAYARRLLDQAAPLTEDSHAKAASYRVVDGALQVTLSDGHVRGLAQPAQLVGFRATRRRPRPCCCSTTGCTSISSSIAARPSARKIRPESATWCWKPRCPPSWTWKTRWLPSMPKTRSWATATGWAS